VADELKVAEMMTAGTQTFHNLYYTYRKGTNISYKDSFLYQITHQTQSR
jgi:hypothetical protein